MLKNSYSFVVCLIISKCLKFFKIVKKSKRLHDVLLVYIGSHQIAVLVNVVKKLCCVMFLTEFVYTKKLIFQEKNIKQNGE